MNKQQENYINGLVTAVAPTLVKESTDGDIFKRARDVMSEVIESGVVEFDSGIQKRIYDALISYRDSLK